MDLEKYNHLLSPERRLARAREQFELNLKHARDLNLEVTLATLSSPSSALDATKSVFRPLDQSIAAMTSNSRSRTAGRSPSPTSRYISPERDSRPIPGSPLAEATTAGGGSIPSDTDDRVSIIISLQAEVERLESALAQERAATATREAELEAERTRQLEEEDEELADANARLRSENAELKEKLLKATRVLGRLRYRKKEMDICD